MIGTCCLTLDDETVTLRDVAGEAVAQFIRSHAFGEITFKFQRGKIIYVETKRGLKPGGENELDSG